MKRLLPLALAAALLLSGCGNIFSDEYHYSAPFAYNLGGDSGDTTEISNYSMLKSALVNLINRHEEHAVFRFSRYNGSVSDDLAAACLEVKTTNPLGAYAVESLSADTSRIVSYYLADVHIEYQKSAEEIASILTAASPAEAEAAVQEAMASYASRLVLRIYSSQVDEGSIAAAAERYALADPVTVVSAPELELRSYPPEGSNRIYELRFDYGAMASQLRTRSGFLRGRIEAMAREMTEERAPLRALEAAKWLSGLTAGNGDAGRSAYDAVFSGSGDSRAVSLAYVAACAALELECIAVRGQIGDMGAEEHWWNILLLEGDYYHVDVSRFAEDPASAFLLDDGSLWGGYLWDAEAYPECKGFLRYADLVPETPPPAPAPAQPPAPTESPAPTEEPPEPTEEPPEPADTPEPEPSDVGGSEQGPDGGAPAPSPSDTP